jgi:phosphotransferase system HPr-like phosphotransfer protein
LFPNNGGDTIQATRKIVFVSEQGCRRRHKMKEMQVVIKTIDMAVHFVDIVSKYSEDMELVYGSYDVDAKSILGILAMDLRDTMTLKVNATEEQFEEIHNALKEFAA